MDRDALSRDGSARPLNVLFVGGYDSTNYAYVELIRELAARGHRSTVVVENERDVVNNKMFAGAGIPTVPLSAYPLADVGSVDFAFSGPFLRRQTRALYDAIYDRRAFLVSFANLFSSVTMRTAPDLVITTAESKFDDFARNGLDYRMVAVGNPQYDPLVRARAARPRVELDSIRKVLVVDQGAYPFGEAGKRQLAETLVRIAENNPQMTFDVKPRYLPSEDGEHLHSVSDHLYSHLRDVPDNLVLIQEPTILEELVLEYDAMITLWSTAHLDAAALGLPLLLIGGLDSVDVFDVRKQRVDAAYEHLRQSGCVVDWRDLQTGPCPFGHVSEEYLQDEFADVSAPCAPKVVDLLERIDETVLQHGRAFAGTFHLSHAEFMSGVETLETRAAGTEEDLLDRRLYRGLNAVAQNLVFDHRCMGFALEMERFLPLWDRRVGPAGTASDVDAAVREGRESGLRLKQAYFESHAEDVAADEFVQDAYFDWLLATGRHMELLAYAGPVIVPQSLESDRGQVFLRRKRPFAAARRFVEAFSISLQRPGRVLKKDKDIKVLLSRTDTSLLAHAILFFLARYGKRDALAVLEVPARPNLDALVFYRMKALVALGRAADARALHSQYVAATRDKTPMTQSSTLENRVLLLVIAYYRGRLRRLAKRLG